ncbi:MAG TPA: hypothetical protein VFE46_11390 [Pirellulales bacterium]|jgi:hypothetical protein|nr:hypothetical protein [Pirellulales bacterium]
MADTQLQTAAYFQPPEKNTFETDTASPAQASGSAAHNRTDWERVSTKISLVTAGAVLVCLVVLAIPYITGIQWPKSGSLGDWWLWLGGAKPDQTFEKFVKDVGAKNQLDWEAAYKRSPTYKLDTTPMYQFNQSSGMRFNPQPARGQFPSTGQR